jgi:protein ImuB
MASFSNLQECKPERRILALWLPWLPTDRLHRQEAAESKTAGKTAAPLVVAAKIDNVHRLSAVDRKAAMLGLAPGMMLATARAMLRDLRVEPANEAADFILLEHIADWCDRFSPFVACLPPCTVLLDITGTAHLFGGEAAMLERIRVSLNGQGFTVRAALAGSAAAACALARYHDGAIAAPGKDAAALAPLPVEALNLDGPTIHALRRAGLKTVAEVSARKRAELTARFGAGMVFTLDQALGAAEKPISPRLPLPDYSVEHHFLEPIVTDTLVLETLGRLALRLFQVLEERGEGARRLEARFFRADGALRRLALATARPLRDAAMIERLFKEKLGALSDPLDPGFGYDLIRLCVTRAEPAVSVASRFDTIAEDTSEIDFLIDRLAARFGGTRILSFRPNDAHIPERAVLAVPAQSERESSIAWDAIGEKDTVPRRPLRLFARPSPVDVIAEIPDGPPVKFRWRRVLHDIARAEGPERIAMEWWRHQKQRPTRDYYRVEDSEGRRFWLFRNGIYERETDAPQWFVHGLFA